MPSPRNLGVPPKVLCLPPEIYAFPRKSNAFPQKFRRSPESPMRSPRNLCVPPKVLCIPPEIYAFPRKSYAFPQKFMRSPESPMRSPRNLYIPPKVLYVPPENRRPWGSFRTAADRNTLFAAEDKTISWRARSFSGEHDHCILRPKIRLEGAGGVCRPNTIAGSAKGLSVGRMSNLGPVSNRP